MSSIRIPPGSLDLFLRSFREPGTVFLLEGATYYTEGMRAFKDLDFCMLAPECSIIGIGDNPATIMLKTLPTDGLYTEVLTGGSRSKSSTGIRVERVKIVCPNQVPTVGLHLWTSMAHVKDVEVTGVAGDRNHSLPNEGFGILVNNAGISEIDGGHHVEECRVVCASGSYVSAIYVGVERRTMATLAPSKVADCSVVSPGNVQSHCGYGINSRVRIERCHASGFSRPFFSDTGGGEDAIIQDCSAYDCQVGVEIRVSNPDWARKGIRVIDSRFHFDRSASSYIAGMVLVAEGAGSAAEISDVELNRCRFVNGSKLRAYMGSSAGPNVAAVVARDCEWIGSPWELPKTGLTLANGAAPWKIVGTTVR